jgi:hypothetical protein
MNDRIPDDRDLGRQLDDRHSAMAEDLESLLDIEAGLHTSIVGAMHRDLADDVNRMPNSV